ncbi:MAG: ComEC/Rec2 family competence protein [Puniceicoccaceae bacterium]
MIPFASGLIASSSVSAGNWLDPGAGAVLLAGLLFGLLMVRSGGGGRGWAGYFLVAAFCLGAMYGGRFFGPPADPVGRPILREEILRINPVQMFAGPPRSFSHIGLAEVEGREGLFYFRAPAGASRGVIPRGFYSEVRGVVRSLEESSFDEGFLEYLRRRDARGVIEAVVPPRTVGVADSGEAVFAILLERAKGALAAGAAEGDPVVPVYQAIVLGQRQGLEQAQKAVFRETGTAHLFAISGLHVGLVGGFLLGVFRLLRMSEPVRVALSLAVLLFYVVLTGSAPSAVRAFLMIAFLLGAKAFQRGYRPESALAASALFVLLFDPEQIFSLGFQLSYTVVLSILVFGVPAAREMIRITNPRYWLPGQTGSRFYRVRQWFFGSLAISVSAFLASGPMMIAHFGILPLSAIFLNLLLVPPATLVLVLGFLSLFAGLLGLPFVCELFNAAARPILEAMVGMVSGAADVPVASLSVVPSAAWMGPAASVAFLGIAFWTGSRPRFRLRFLAPPTGLLAVLALLAGKS